jgi:ubiquinone/menaquinone biosynthesis C-methylase UbiE
MKYRKKLGAFEFKAMQGVMKLIDTVHPHVPALSKSFGIQPGMTVVDYGCGPGRYTVELAKITGASGKVYAVDLVEIALHETQKRLNKNGVSNVELKLAQGYDSGVPRASADMICAIDMFHHIDPEPFLIELDAIAKAAGVIVISGGHQSRNSIKQAVAESGLWVLTDESKLFMRFEKAGRKHD